MAIPEGPPLKPPGARGRPFGMGIRVPVSVTLSLASMLSTATLPGCPRAGLSAPGMVTYAFVPSAVNSIPHGQQQTGIEVLLRVILCCASIRRIDTKPPWGFALKANRPLGAIAVFGDQKLNV